MKKRFIVSVVAVLALAALASPAFAQRVSSHSRQVAATRGVHALSARSLGVVHSAAPQANWTLLPAMNTAVTEIGGGAFAQNKLNVPGGFNSGGNLTDQMQIYSAQSNTWSTDADHLSNLSGLPGVADAAVCADTSGKIHVVNGTLDGLSIYAAHFVFDPAAPVGSKWSALAFPSTVADGNFYSQDSGCAFIQGKMYLFGGYGLTDLQGVAQLERLTWVYDPATNLWSNTNRLMVQGRIWQGYAASPSRVFVAGGSGDLVTLQSSAKTETFTPSKGWKPMKDLPTSVLAPGVGLLGSTLAVFGGGTGNGSIGFTLQTKTVGCVGGGCATTGFTDLNKTLNTARFLTAWGSGGGKLYDAGGSGAGNIVLSSAETTA